MRETVRDRLLPGMEARVTKKEFTSGYHPTRSAASRSSSAPDWIEAIWNVLEITDECDDIGTIARLWTEFKETFVWKRYSQYARTDYKQCATELL